MFLKSSFIKREKSAKKKLTFLALALAMCLNQTACGAGRDTVSSTPPAPTNEVANEKVGKIKIRIKVGDKEATATLNDSPTARDLVSLLPLTLDLEDYVKREKIGYPPRKLTTEGAPASGDSDAGDVAYYAPWGNLAIFYNDTVRGSGNGLIILGKIDSNKEIFNVPGSLKATMEMII